ncbi:hypothetical protein CK203_063512 [Vitis vinifera]|uniref:Uncharacterized protein n=1 Tax=Vitis vinifera TaxID=29760 RepID=A0A438G619_VITVI|nr:hypothetical protein CK203_063512 [Vitis vinifera]
MYGYQSSYTSSWNNHPNLTTQPQPQPSMSTSSLEQAILKISKVMEDFVGEQQKINSHLNEKIDNLESSINGKRKLPPQPHHNLQGTNAKRSRKVLKIDTLVGDCYDNSMDQPSIENHKVQDDKGLPEPFKASTSPGKRRETNSLGPNGKDANFVWDPGGIQHEVGVYDACKNRSYGENKGKQGRKAKTEQFAPPISKLLGTFRSLPEVHFMLLYLVSKLGKSGVHRFKRCSFGVETKKLWLFEDDCAKLNRECCGRTPFWLLLDTFLEHFLELNYAIPYLFLKLRKSGVQCFQTVCDLDLKRRSYGHLKESKFCIWAGE